MAASERDSKVGLEPSIEQLRGVMTAAVDYVLRFSIGRRRLVCLTLPMLPAYSLPTRLNRPARSSR